MATIELQQLVKTYPNGFTAVHGIDLAIRDGEFMVLVGPSGCGKTTTLRMIAGLEDVTSGSIRLDQQAIEGIEPKDRDIAMVFQNYALYPHMTVARNLGYALSLRGMPVKDIEQRVDEVARTLSLERHLDMLPRHLSGGQRQRVALGRAMVRRPKAFLFDEPLSNLDAKLRSAMRYELKTLHRALGTTAVYVTHDQIEAMTLGDRITVMSGGRIQQLATPTVIYDHPWNRFVAGFVGTPAMNFLDGILDQRDGAWALLRADGARISLAMPQRDNFPRCIGQPVVLGIRPEHLRDQRFAADVAGSTTLQLRVTVVEMMGNHHCVYLTMPGLITPLVMIGDPHQRVNPGDVIPVTFSTTLAHVFGPEGEAGQNLTLPDGFAQIQNI